MIESCLIKPDFAELKSEILDLRGNLLEEKNKRKRLEDRITNLEKALNRVFKGKYPANPLISNLDQVCEF